MAMRRVQALLLICDLMALGQQAFKKFEGGFFDLLGKSTGARCVAHELREEEDVGVVFHVHLAFVVGVSGPAVALQPASHITQHTSHSTQHTAHSTQDIDTAHSTQHTGTQAHNTQHTDTAHTHKVSS